MRIGTKSILFGVHCPLVHTWFVAIAWWKLYGPPWDPRLWFAFALHDIGYWGKPNMDGAEGEGHVEAGAKLMATLFGNEWGNFCRYHSRFAAKRDGRPFSRLCVADKMAAVIMPTWLYLIMARASGEIEEYMARARTKGDKYTQFRYRVDSERAWLADFKTYINGWVREHKNGEEDRWT